MCSLATGVPHANDLSASSLIVNCNVNHINHINQSALTCHKPNLYLHPHLPSLRRLTQPRAPP